MKNDYNRSYFWTSIDENGTKRYYFKLNDQLVEVSKDVFNICYSSYKKQLRDIKRDMLFSLMSFDDPRLESLQLLKIDKNLLDNIYKKDMVKDIMNSINNLDEDEKKLIANLLILEKTEREMAKILGVNQANIHRSKMKIIEKIKNNIKK